MSSLQFSLGLKMGFGVVGEVEDVVDVRKGVVEDVGAVADRGDGCLVGVDLVGDPLVDVVDLDDVCGVAVEDVVASETCCAVEVVVADEEVEVDDAWCACSALFAVLLWVVELGYCSPCRGLVLEEGYDVVVELVDGVVEVEEAGAVCVVEAGEVVGVDDDVDELLFCWVDPVVVVLHGLVWFVDRGVFIDRYGLVALFDAASVICVGVGLAVFEDVFDGGSPCVVGHRNCWSGCSVLSRWKS